MAEDLTNAAAPSSGASNEPGETPSLAPAASEPANDSSAPLSSEPERPNEENRIPHWRVKEMLGEREAKIHAEYQARIKDFESRLAAFQGKGPAPGPTPDSPADAPESPAAAEPSESAPRLDWRALMREGERTRERENAMRAQYERAATVRIESERFHLSWNAVRDAHQDILDMPGASAALREAALQAWRTGGDPIEAARAAARPFQHQRAQLDLARDTRRAALRAQAPKTTRGGKGAGAPAMKSTGSIGERISDRLAGGRSGNGY